MEHLQNYKEERLNVITHAIAALASCFGLFILTKNISDEYVYAKPGAYVYGFSLIFLYLASSTYHFVRSNKLKKTFRVLDHISIYILIAGTYTPICLTALKESQGSLLLVLVWAITLIGSILKLFFTGKFEKISLLLYLVMGWLILIDIQYVLSTFSREALVYLVAGGIAYSVGIIFYTRYKLNYHHVIWHIFVILGSLFHFLMIYQILK
ncbi:PAQR family membrane homeostasis protein TrhA [Psychroflexus sp. ALD_RP9]|uniref:PAQR family membrane homeostasis protein TrhA n=1 Tax=Psychroflexus sp. ALD_RP9 TaxID=2777186 RepID=UPI001A8DF574|nr:hemolysin III family protein [Psychroflexus sp. ALD_RP9]QSS97210.1 hemolysin III family protein [Psychroflexus sp. ALD_RP9]